MNEKAMVKVLADFPDVMLEVAMSTDGGEFRRFIEKRHGQMWVMTANEKELREEVVAYRASKGGGKEVVH